MRFMDVTRRARPIPAIALGLLLALTAACSDRAGAQKAPPPTPAVPVMVAEVAQRTVPLEVTAVGNVQASTTVTVKSQIAGQIDRVHFTEGREVKRDDLLFTIDPRPFEAALRQAEAALGQRRAEILQASANVARDVAQQEWTQVQERRYAELLAKDLIAREQYEQIRTNAAAMEATLRANRAAEENARAATAAAQAAVDNARLNLAYTKIAAPIDGRTGNLLVQPGNVVKANEGDLVVIASVHPIHVSFAVPEQQLGVVKRFQAAGTLAVRANAPNQGDHGRHAQLPEQHRRSEHGHDPAEGHVREQRELPLARPVRRGDADARHRERGRWCRRRPSRRASKGPSCSWSSPTSAWSRARCEPGRRLERETIVTSGLKAGERVVTDGQLRLIPGALVEVKTGKAS